MATEPTVCPLCKEIIDCANEEDCVAHMSTCRQFAKTHGADARASREVARAAEPTEEAKYCNDDVPEQPRCSGCGLSSSSALLRCGKCKAVYYCNQKCQQSHWKSHKHLCKALSHMLNTKVTPAVSGADASEASTLVQSAGAVRNSKEDFKATVKHEMEIFCKYPESVQVKIFQDNARVRDDPCYKDQSDAEVKMLFMSADTDKDDALNAMEWVDFVEKMCLWEESKFGQAPRTSPEEVAKRFEAYDVEGKGKVTYANYQQRESEKETLGAELAAEFMEASKA